MIPRPPISTLFPYTTLFRSISKICIPEFGFVREQSSESFEFQRTRPWSFTCSIGCNLGFLITPDAHGRRLICNLPAFRCRLGPNERSCPHGGYLWIGLFWPSCSGRLQYSCQSQPLPTCLPSRQRPFGAPSQTLPAL